MTRELQKSVFSPIGTLKKDGMKPQDWIVFRGRRIFNTKIGILVTVLLVVHIGTTLLGIHHHHHYYASVPTKQGRQLEGVMPPLPRTLQGESQLPSTRPRQHGSPSTSSSTSPSVAKKSQKQNERKPTVVGRVVEEDKAEGEEYPIQYLIDTSIQQGHDKERILYLLRDNAGMDSISYETYQELPAWDQIASLYGSAPKLNGLDQHCQAFQQKGGIDALADKRVGVAGMFNSGTNLLAMALQENCELHHRFAQTGRRRRDAGVLWQVTFGKHTPPKDEAFREEHRIKSKRKVDPRQVLPVVTVRDPFRWMQSMCKNQYAARWPRLFRPTTITETATQPQPFYHCPNLWPTKVEQVKLRERGYKPLVDGVDALEREGPPRSPSEAVFDDQPIRNKKKKESKLRARITTAIASMTTGQLQQLAEAYPNTTLISQEELQLHHFPVHVIYNNFTRNHYSLVHLWNDWHQEWMNFKATDYPRVFVRMEDLLYFPNEVIGQVCQCAGGRLIHTNETTGKALPVKLARESLKEHHKSRGLSKEEKQKQTDYLSALIKYAQPSTRFQGMTPQDLQYASHYLDKKLMQTFQYDYPPPPKDKPARKA